MQQREKPLLPGHYFQNGYASSAVVLDTVSSAGGKWEKSCTPFWRLLCGFVLQLLPGFQTASRYKFKGFAAGTNERCAGVQCADGANIPILPEDYLTQRDELPFLNIEFLSLCVQVVNVTNPSWHPGLMRSCN